MASKRLIDLESILDKLNVEMERRDLYYNQSFITRVAFSLLDENSEYPGTDEEFIEAVLRELEMTTITLDWKEFSQDAVPALNSIFGTLWR